MELSIWLQKWKYFTSIATSALTTEPPIATTFSEGLNGELNGPYSQLSKNKTGV